MRRVTVQPLSARELWSGGGLAGNARRVAETLRTRGRSTRAELMASTGLSRPTISATLAELAAAGLIVEETGGQSMMRRGGRPASVVRLARRAGLAVGVDLGRRHLHVAVADLGHAVLVERTHRFGWATDDHPVDALDEVASMIDWALSSLDAPPDAVAGVGLGIPVPLTRDGRIGSPALMPAWASLSPAEELAARAGMPVWVDNDANLGALGEYVWGAGSGCRVLVFIKLATGIGAGILLDGRLFRGGIGTAGELGHVTLDARGPVCRCGNRGCVELSAGGRALLETVRRTHPEIASLAELVDRAEAGDPGCRRLLTDAGTELGIALGSLVNLLNPQRIVLGGDLGRAELMIDPLRRGLANTGMPAAVEAVEVVPAALGERAIALGGVALVLKAAEHTASHFAAVASPG
jgi:predicted NBD/HSP70 family sugar kinase